MPSLSTITATTPAATPPPAEQQRRAAGYALLGALLRAPPDAALLAQIAPLAEQPGSDRLALATRMLGLAAQRSAVDALEEEYHALFIGIGRGELMPYGSWYLTGFLMERPLSRLRDELATLGYQRDPQVREPEDHIAALCEVMTMLIQEGRPFADQAGFQQRHLAPWAGRFFADLEVAEAARFYRALGRFGAAFMAFEQRYFEMQV